MTGHAGGAPDGDLGLASSFFGLDFDRGLGSRASRFGLH